MSNLFIKIIYIYMSWVRSCLRGLRYVVPSHLCGSLIDSRGVPDRH